MGVVGLTKKKLKDVRFRKTEEAIFEAFFDEKREAKLSVGELAKKIGVNRVTVYRHHRAMYEIVEDYERYVLEEYEKIVQKVRMRDKVDLRRIYYEMLVFILQNRRIFEALIKRGDLKIVEEMMLALKLEIIEFAKLPSHSEKILRVYIGEIVELIVDWGLGGFKEVELVKLLNNMIYLTNTVKGRLLVLEN